MRHGVLLYTRIKALKKELLVIFFLHVLMFTFLIIRWTQTLNMNIFLNHAHISLILLNTKILALRGKINTGNSKLFLSAFTSFCHCKMLPLNFYNFFLLYNLHFCD